MPSVQVCLEEAFAKAYCFIRPEDTFLGYGWLAMHSLSSEDLPVRCEEQQSRDEVLGKAEKESSVLSSTERVTVTGASRTDTGVNANGQAFHVDIFLQRTGAVGDLGEIEKSVNSFLQSSHHEIRIRNLREVGSEVDACRSSRGKRYVYLVYDGVAELQRQQVSYHLCDQTEQQERKRAEAEELTGDQEAKVLKIDCSLSPRTRCFYDLYGPEVRKYNRPALKQLDVEKMRQVCDFLSRTNEPLDFRRFTRSEKRCSKTSSRSTKRLIFQCKIIRLKPVLTESQGAGEQAVKDETSDKAEGQGNNQGIDEDYESRGGMLRFEIEGEGFLYLMVRCLVRMLIEVGRGKLKVAEALQSFHFTPEEREHFDEAKVYSPAPANGLCLEEVFYEVPLDSQHR